MFLLQRWQGASHGSEPRHCSCEEPFTLCLIQPSSHICGCAGDFSIPLPPSAFWSLSAETACWWRFGRLTCTFRGKSFGARVQMKSALPKCHCTSQFSGHGKVMQSSFENPRSSLSSSIWKARPGLFLFPFVLSIQRKGLWDLDLLRASGYNSNK